MQNEILGAVSFAAQYAKDMDDGRESWIDAVNRVEQMHLKKFANNFVDISDQIKWAFDLVREKRVFPSQRSMQFGGHAIMSNNMRIYNCTFSYCDRTRFFAEAFWLLLSGCGTGFSVRKKHVEKMPKLIPPKLMQSRPNKTYVIPDNIEGWADAVWCLINSYCLDCYYSIQYDHELVFDYSKIRLKGAPISSGGYAPGYRPLEIAIEKIRLRLQQMVMGTRSFSPIDCLDIAMYLSEAVLAGGVRRSASIAIFDHDDDLMMTAKQGDWWKEQGQRAFANISAGIKLDGNEKRSIVDEIIQGAKEWGEPGVAFFKSDEHGTNPCAEIGLMPTLVRDFWNNTTEYITIEMLEDKEKYATRGYKFASGWQACNLTEVNMSKNKTTNEFLEACRAASFIGTLQASYTFTGYLAHPSKMILESEALIGVSLTGMCENPLSFDPEVLQAGAEMVNKQNRTTAEAIGIKHASRTTCIKPSGNTSTVAGGISSGIHPHHAKRYIRRMRLSKINPIWTAIKSAIPEVCIDQDGQTGIVSFACSAPEGSLTRENDSALAHLERVKLVYENWIAPGSKQTRVEGLTHNVSNTCTVKHDEWDDVADFIWNNREALRGVALLGYIGDHKYINAPYQTVVDDDASEVLWTQLAQVDWSKVNLNVLGAGENPVVDGACGGGECTIKF